VIQLDPAIFLAAFGIILLEMSEASAISMALSVETKSNIPLFATSLGVIVVLLPTSLIGSEITLLPLIWVRAISATLLLYFAQRLAKSAKRSMKFQHLKNFPKSHKEEAKESGVSLTAFMAGVIEAFEAAIVLVGLYPENYNSTLLGIILGSVLVIAFSVVLRSQIRKLKQAIMKVVVSSLLFTFSAFWYMEIVIKVNELLLIPLFILFSVLVYEYSIYGLKNLDTSKEDTK
jgi:uncharacterized membrane protein